jgi:hypothetical protein
MLVAAGRTFSSICHVEWLSEGWYICHNKQMQLWHVTFATPLNHRPKLWRRESSPKAAICARSHHLYFDIRMFGAVWWFTS